MIPFALASPLFTARQDITAVHTKSVILYNNQIQSTGKRIQFKEASVPLVDGVLEMY